MATAKGVIDADRKGLTWIAILDTDGGRSTYHKRGPAPAAAIIHIHQRHATGIEIVLDDKGRILLHQDGPGLPASINVFLLPVNPGGTGPGLAVAFGWGGGIFVYEQQKHS
jgi:hypothetical protein